MFLPIIAFASLAAAAPYALTNPTGTHSIEPRADTCETPGALLCQGSSKWAICSEINSVVWQDTADGTSCACESDGTCSIVLSGEVPTAAGSAPTTTNPAPVSTSSAFATISTVTPPGYTAPASPSSSVTAPPPTSSGSNYTQFSGNGSPEDGWPTMSDWLSFEDLFKAYEPIMGQSCTDAFSVPNTPKSAIPVLHDALLNESAIAGVPPQFSLAVMMQESLGCIFVDTTNNGVVNPGLFQDHDGSATCYQKSSCPASEIQGMVKQGICGTSSGAGLKGCAAQAPATGAQKFYQAARIYNSGSLPAGGNLGVSLGSTSCYASDIANRLIGWTSGESQCTLTA